MPPTTPRSSIGIASYLNGSIYTFGGIKDDGLCNNCEAYNIENDEWTVLSPMQVKISHASSTVINGEIFVCGYGSNMIYKYKPDENKFIRILQFESEDHKIMYSAYNNLYIICNKKIIEYETKSDNRVRKTINLDIDRSLYLLSYIVTRKNWVYFLLSDKFVYRINIFDRDKFEKFVKF